MERVHGGLGYPRPGAVHALGKKQAATAATSGWVYGEDEFVQLGASSSISGEQFAASQLVHEVSRRLVALEASYFEDYGRELNSGSRTAFECFMKYTADVKLPLLGAEESGAIVATWVVGPECLSIRFVDRYVLDYAVTYNTSEGLRRSWGRSTLVTVFGDCTHVRRLAAAD